MKFVKDVYGNAINIDNIAKIYWVNERICDSINFCIKADLFVGFPKTVCLYNDFVDEDDDDFKRNDVATKRKEMLENVCRNLKAVKLDFEEMTI